MADDPPENYYEFSKAIAWELLYRTIIDCHKIATQNSDFFEYGTKLKYLHQNEAQTLEKARKEIEEWINSDAFYFYAYELGFNPQKAVEGAYKVLNGGMIGTEEEELLKILHKQRKRNAKTTKTEGVQEDGTREFDPRAADDCHAAIAYATRYGTATTSRRTTARYTDRDTNRGYAFYRTIYNRSFATC